MEEDTPSLSRRCGMEGYAMAASRGGVLEEDVEDGPPGLSSRGYTYERGRSLASSGRIQEDDKLDADPPHAPCSLPARGTARSSPVQRRDRRGDRLAGGANAICRPRARTLTAIHDGEWTADAVAPGAEVTPLRGEGSGYVV